MYRVFAVLCLAGSALRADSVLGGDGVLPHLADGGSWRTMITLVNLEETAAPFTLRFYRDNGAPLFLPLIGGSNVSSVSLTIPARGTRTIETAGAAAGLTWGWAFLETTETIGGTATMRYTPPGQASHQAQFPIDTRIDSKFALPLDHQNGASVGLAIVNPVSYAAAQVFLIFRDEAGNQFLVDSFSLPPLNHVAVTLTDRYPQTVGRRGTVEVSTSAIWLNVLAINYQAGSFSTVTPQSHWLW